MIDKNEKSKLKITVQAFSTGTGQQPNKQINRLKDTKQQTNRQNNKKHTQKQTQEQTCSGQTHTERLTKSEK